MKVVQFQTVLLLLFALAHGGCAQASVYSVEFAAEFTDAPQATVIVNVGQDTQILRELDLYFPADRYQFIGADGQANREKDRLVWVPPASGGTLTFLYSVSNRRDENATRTSGRDAHKTQSWVIARLGDLFPRAKVRTLKGAKSVSTLSLRGPKGWRFETRYGSLRGDDTALEVPREGRNLTRPTGWLVGGLLATRRETIADRKIAVSAPRGSGLKHLDLLTFLGWTLPEVAKVVPSLPERILIVGGPDGMWRGALSGPGSLYLHHDRPFVSGNGTSTVLHELFHIAGLHSADQADWIVEGLAEYYSLEVLRRAGGLSEERYARGLEKLELWADEKSGRLSSPSKGADTARAVLLFAELARELEASGASLDSVVRQLIDAQMIDVESLHHIVERELGGPSRTFDRSVVK